MRSFINSHREGLLRLLHICGLCGLAVAQPLLDVLSRNATFFVANRISRWEILLLVAVLCVGLPLLLAGLTQLIRLVKSGWARRFHLVQVAAVSGILALSIISKLSFTSGTVSVLLAAGLGIVYATLYRKKPLVQSFTSVLSLALILVPANFLFFSPVKKLVFSSASIVIHSSNSNTPVVLVIFDEFALTSLMNEQHEIDSLRYPRFGELAKHSNWYRNASTVTGSTDMAVPAIMTGLRPNASSPFIASYVDYPNNIYTLLGGTYKIHRLSSVTSLLPPELEERDSSLRQPANSLSRLWSDLSFVYLHIVLPKDYARELPSISQNWGGFAQGNIDLSTVTDSSIIDSIHSKLFSERQKNATYINENRVKRYRDLLGEITRTPQPALVVMHNLLPHVPWEYLPSGKRYLLDLGSKIPGLDMVNEKWNDDTTAVLQGYQRFLLQAQFVDQLVGELVDRLKAIGMYDESLLIITADHGVSFRPNEMRRAINDTTAGDIVPIPLFVKLPFQQEPHRIDRNVEEIDILPTIGDVLNQKIPWPVDGVSLLNESAPERKEKIVFEPFTKTYQSFTPSLDRMYRSLNRQLDLFGSGADPGKFYRLGDGWGIVGRPVKDLPLVGGEKFSAWIRNQHYYEHVDLGSEFLLARIRGRIDCDRPDQRTLAVSVNGVIRAVTRPTKGEEGEFAAMVPQASFQQGRNSIRVFMIGGTTTSPRLVPPSETIAYTYTQQPDGREELKDQDGKLLPIEQNHIYGSIEMVTVQHQKLIISGWAADGKHKRLPDRLAVFVNGKFFHLDSPDLERPDIVAQFKTKDVLNSGYYFSLAYGSVTVPEVRLFAIAEDGSASELFRFQSSESKGSPGRYSYSLDRHALRAGDGSVYAVMNDSIEGNVDAFDIDSQSVRVAGWAADGDQGDPADSVLLMVGLKNILTLSTGVSRPDLVKAMGKKKLMNSGFDYAFPLSILQSPGDTNRIEVYALSQKSKVVSKIFPLKNSSPAPAGQAMPGSKKLSIVYSLAEDSLFQVLYLRNAASRPIPAVDTCLSGNIDLLTLQDGRMTISGWAADISSFRPANQIAIFSDGKLISAFGTGVERPDLVSAYRRKSILKSGFYFTLTLPSSENFKENSLRVFAISTEKNIAFELHRLSEGKSPAPAQSGIFSRPIGLAFSLGESQHAFLTSSQTDYVKIVKNSLQGSIDTLYVSGDTVYFSGWAADIQKFVPAQLIAVFVNGRNIKTVTTGLSRPDVALAYRHPSLQGSGFRYGIPLSGKDKPEIRFFAIAKPGTTTSELKYSKKSPFEH